MPKITDTYMLLTKSNNFFVNSAIALIQKEKKAFVINQTHITMKMTSVCFWIVIADKNLQFPQKKHLYCELMSHHSLWFLGRTRNDFLKNFLE